MHSHRLRRLESSLLRSQSVSDGLPPPLPITTRSTTDTSRPQSSSASLGGRKSPGGSTVSLRDAFRPISSRINKLATQSVISGNSGDTQTIHTEKDKPIETVDSPRTLIPTAGPEVTELESLFTRPSKGKSPLEVIKSLWKRGDLDPNEPVGRKSSILTLAVKYNNTEMVEFLLSNGATLSKSESGIYETILTCSAIHGNADITRMLLTSGSPEEPALASPLGTHALHEAIYASKYEVVKTLLAAKADPNAMITAKYADSIEKLKKKGKKYEGGWRCRHRRLRPLHIALKRAVCDDMEDDKRVSKNGTLAIVSLLITNGADASLGDEQDRTAIKWLEDGDDLEVKDMLRVAFM